MILVVGPPIGLLLISAVGDRSAFDSRYLTVCVAPLYVMSGWLWSRLVRPGLRPVAGAVAVAAAIALTLWQNQDPDNPKLYELREAMQTVNAMARPGDAVMIVPQHNELGGKDPVIEFYEPRDGLRYVDTSPPSRRGVVPPEEMWTRVSRTEPGQLFVLYGPSTLDETREDDASTTYDGFISSKSRQLTRLDYANVSVKVYAPRWQDAGRIRPLPER